MSFVQSLYSLSKLSNLIHRVCVRNINTSSEISNVKKYSKKILEILDENIHKTTTTQNEVEKVISTHHKSDNNSDPFSEYQQKMNTFIRKCTSDSIIEGWKLFQTTKSNSDLSENKAAIDAVYSSAIKLILNADKADTGTHTLSRKAFNRMMALKEEINDKNNNETATLQCDIMIISTCLKIKQYRKAMDIYKNVLKNTEKHKYFVDSEFCEMMSKFYAENNYVFEGIKFLNDIHNLYEMIPNNAMINYLLRSIAFNINKENKDMYLRSVETLFTAAFGDTNSAQYPNIAIFQALLDIYSKLGELDACFNILQYIDHPNVICYNLALRSCLKCDDEELLRNKDDGWYYIDYVLNEMKEGNVMRNEYVYDTLFLFCSKNTVCNAPNFERLQLFYEQMIEDKLHNISLNTLSNWWMAGMDYFEHQINTSDSYDDMQRIYDDLVVFKDFVIKQCQRLFSDTMLVDTKYKIESRVARIQLLTQPNNRPIKNWKSE